MKSYYTFKLNQFCDNRGKLISLLDTDSMPFDVKRIYYILGAKKDASRGKLAHKSLEQVLVSVSGGCKVLLDNGKQKDIVELNEYNKALYINKGIWREIFDFSPDCILFSLNSEFYNENEIIRDYEQFIKFSKEQDQ